MKKRLLSVSIALLLVITIISFIPENRISAAVNDTAKTSIFTLAGTAADNSIVGNVSDGTAADNSADDKSVSGSYSGSNAADSTSNAEADSESAAGTTINSNDETDTPFSADSTAVTADLGRGEAVYSDNAAGKILSTLSFLMVESKDLFADGGLDLSSDGKKDVDIEINTSEDGKISLILKKTAECTLQDDVTLTLSDSAESILKLLHLDFCKEIIFRMAEPVQPDLIAVFAGSKQQRYPDNNGKEQYLDTMWFYYEDMTFTQYAFLDDSLQVFSRGTYEFKDGGDFYDGPAYSDQDNITINRTHKYIAGKGLTEYESSHTYDLHILDYEPVYISQKHIDEAEKTAAKKEDAGLVIIHTNDVHGYLEASDSCLGIEAVSQLKKDYEEKGYDVLLLDAGDAFQGNILVNESEGKTAVDLMNDAGYDAMALGNHDFDYGADVLEKRMAECDFPVLAANITVDATGKPFTKENTVFTLKDGTKVGVFGLDTPSAKTTSTPKNTAGLTFSEKDTLYKAAQKQIDELNEKGCSVIVCLGHLGEEEINKDNNAKDIVENTSGLDVFIDAHDHDVENQTVKDVDGNDVLIVETGCYLKNIGVLSYDGNKFSEELVETGKYKGSDSSIKKNVEKAVKKVQKTLSEKVASVSFFLNGQAREFPGVRTSETNLGDLAADAIYWQVSQAAAVKPDAAVLNGGAIRTSIDAEDITMLDIRNVFPFNDQLCTIEVTGEQLLEALEAATQAMPDAEGSFPQVSQIKYTLDTTVEYRKGEQYPGTTYYAPAAPGSRVTITEVGGKPFDKNATYTIAVASFLAEGGDTYYVFAEAADKSKSSVGYLDYEALINYMEDELGGTIPDTYKEPQGRITIIE